MRNLIPSDLLFSHDYCFFLHDLLAGLVVVGEHAGTFNHRMHIEKEVATKFKEKSGEELFVLLENNGYEDDLNSIIYKQVTIALLSDFCHFLYEALDCSAKGKLTVTFALLRKPLKENLLYFEWMLADPNDFLQKFRSKIQNQKLRPLPYAPNVPPERRLEIITDAMEKTKLGGFIGPDFIHELRYDKHCNYGFEQLFQRANHLITTHTAPTEEQNLNFIFSGDLDHKAQWEGLYSFLPLLLYHATQVITSVIDTFAPDFVKDSAITELRTQLGLLLWIQEGPWRDSPWQTGLAEEISNLLLTLQEISMECLNCHAPLEINRKDMYQLYTEGGVDCSQCNYHIHFTTDRDRLFLNHLRQGGVTCPECSEVVQLNESNMELFLKKRVIVCDACKEEIEITSG